MSRVTSDERRDVAKGLRYIANCCPPVQCLEQFRSALKDELFTGPGHVNYTNIFIRLADLIDPICEGVEEREDDGIDAPPRYTSHCGNCGQMWDETSGIPRFPMYCPNCGARVVRGRLNPWVVKD